MTSTNNNAAKLTLDNLEQKIFAPEQLAEGAAFLKEVQALGSYFVANFTNDTVPPDNYGLLIAPLQRRKGDGTGNETFGAIAAMVPTLEALSSHGPEGLQFVRDAVLQNMRTKIANAARPDKDMQPKGTIPFTIQDFIEDRSPDGMMKAFNTVGPNAVTALREKGMSFMNLALLKQLLMSAAFAETQFPKIKQEIWVNVGNLIIKMARDKSLDVSMIENWLATRDNAAASEIENIDISALETGMAKVDADKAKRETEKAESAAKAKAHAAALAGNTSAQTQQPTA